MARSSRIHPSARKEDRLALEAVVTISEAVERWNKNRKSIEKAIDRGRLSARKSNGTFLITTSSLVAIWGDPLDTETWEIIS